MTDCQLMIDPPQTGSWNMAVDEWLLGRALEDGVMTLRFYQWDTPTLSLGYFQKYDDRSLHAASIDCPVVRRASGGGALVHDRELTYTLAVPASHPLARDTQSLYDAAHETLVDLLGRIVPPGEGRFSLNAETQGRGGGEPFLCFLRRAKGDVIFTDPTQPQPLTADGSHKICGSAQRKHHGAVVQHGGVLLGRSLRAPELSGLAELTGLGITPEKLAELWVSSLGGRLDLRLAPAEPLSPAAFRAIAEIEAAKFASPGWTHRR
jgi:lipoate-protein ligase A